MRRKKKFEWKAYIRELSEFPAVTQEWERDLTKIVFDNIPREVAGEVLEIGCSNGRWLRWFNREFGCRVWGIDREREGFRGNVDAIRFAVGDALNIPYKDNFFNVVFSLGLVEHFRKEDKYQILREQERVLKEGGYLICQTPLLSFFSLDYLYVKYVYDFKRGTKHFRTTKRELTHYFGKLGLRIIFSGFTGCLLEMDLFKRLRELNIVGSLFATEILIIGRKVKTC